MNFKNIDLFEYKAIDRSPSNPYLDSKLKKIDHDNIDNILDGILEDPRGDGV